MNGLEYKDGAYKPRLDTAHIAAVSIGGGALFVRVDKGYGVRIFNKDGEKISTKWHNLPSLIDALTTLQNQHLNMVEHVISE